MPGNVFSVDHMPPLRPVPIDGGDIAILFPLYMSNPSYLAGQGSNASHIVGLRLGPARIEVTVYGLWDPVGEPVENEARAIAIRLSLIADVISNLMGSTPTELAGIKSYRRAIHHLGFHRHVHVYLVFTKRGAEAAKNRQRLTIYFISGYGTLVGGRSQEPLYIHGLLVTAEDEDVTSILSRLNGRSANGISYMARRSDPHYIIDQGKIRGIIIVPVYPRKRARGAKFYPLTVTIPLVGAVKRVGQETWIGTGSIMEKLVGSSLSFRAGDAILIEYNNGLVRAKLRSGSSMFLRVDHVPSSALLSVRGPTSKPWHDYALTITRGNASVVTVALDSSKVNRVIHGILEIIAWQLWEGFRSLGLLNGNSAEIDISILRRFASRLKSLADDIRLSDLENAADALASHNISSNLNIAVFMRSPPARAGMSVDPKMIAKALTSYETARFIIGRICSTNTCARKLAGLVSSLRYKYMGPIVDPLSNLIANAGLQGQREILDYLAGKPYFIPDMRLALAYLALREALQARPTSAASEAALVVTAWYLLLYAYALSIVGSSRARIGPLIISAGIGRVGGLDEAVAFWALTRGAHSLSHITMRIVAETLGISRPRELLREIVVARLEDYRSYAIFPQGSPNRSGVIVDGGLVIANTHSNQGLSITIAALRPELYLSLKSSLSAQGPNVLAGACSTLSGIVTPADRCEQAWQKNSPPPASIASIRSSIQQAAGAVDRILGPLSPVGSAGGAVSVREKYYPPIVTAQSLAERAAIKALRSLPGGKRSLPILKAHIGQYVRSLIPHCYDGCYHCVMTEECFARVTPLQERLVSKSAALLMCKLLGYI